MYDIVDIINNVNDIYNSNDKFTILKDFERVFDELDLYVYDNWKDGELCSGPNISRHWVTCCFMWPRNKMPDPMGAKRLFDYDCKITFQKTHVLKARKIKTPDDLRPNTKKGKVDRHPVWIVEIKMPKRLIADIYTGYNDAIEAVKEPATPVESPAAAPAEEAAISPEAAPTDAGVSI